VRTARNFAIVALIAAALAFLPGGSPTLGVVLSLLGIAFFTAIAFLGYRLYQEHRFTLDSFETPERLVFYGSIALAFLALVGWLGRAAGGVGIVVCIVLLALASCGVYWSVTHSRRYD
jgi:hypothetical protein